MDEFDSFKGHKNKMEFRFLKQLNVFSTVREHKMEFAGNRINTSQKPTLKKLPTIWFLDL